MKGRRDKIIRMLKKADRPGLYPPSTFCPGSNPPAFTNAKKKG